MTIHRSTRVQITSSTRLQLIYLTRFVTVLLSNMMAGIFAVRILEATGSASLVSLLVALRMGGSALGALFSVKVRQYISLSGLLLVADTLAASSLIIAALAPDSVFSAALLGTGFVLGVCFGLSNITLISVLPELVGQERRHIWNGLIQVIQSVAIVISGLSIALIYTSGTITIQVLLAALFFLAAGCAASWAAPFVPPSKVIQTLKPRTANRLKFWISSQSLPIIFLLVVLARAAEAFGSGIHNVGFPILSAIYDSQHPARLAGYLLSAWGLGKIVAGWIVPIAFRRLPDDDQQPLLIIFLASNVITLILFLGLFQSHALAIYLGFSLLAGLFDSATEISYYSYLQVTPDVYRKRLLGMSYAIERGALFIGILFAGTLLNIISLQTAAFIYYAGTIFIILCICCLIRRVSLH